MGSPLRLGCRVRGRHAADLQQGLILWAGISPSHPTWNAPVPSLGSGLATPNPGTLGSPFLAPNLPLPAQTSPLAPASVEGPSVPTALEEDSIPKTPHQFQPTAVDRRVHSPPQGPSLAQSHTRTISGLPTQAFISPDLSGPPHPPGPLDPKAEMHPKPPHPPPAPLMSLSTPTPPQPQGCPQTTLYGCLLKGNDGDESLTPQGWRRGLASRMESKLLQQRGVPEPPGLRAGPGRPHPRPGHPTGTACFDSWEGLGRPLTWPRFIFN